MPKNMPALKFQLFSDPVSRVFAILDGASVPALLPKLAALEPEHVCLYRGQIAADMAEVAPYLVMLEHDAPFTDWILDIGWGEHWGIFGVALADLSTLRNHFRKFLTVYDHTGKSLYFRFYDPRVLQMYLPTCNVYELKALFGPVIRFTIESESPDCTVSYTLTGGNLCQEDQKTTREIFG